jgi:hypothetical protein
VRSDDRAASETKQPKRERWGEGPLQTLYDAWQGKVRPIAEAGFGLPELFTLLSEVTQRPVPRSDAEAAVVQRLYAQIGPLAKKATETTLRRLRRELGPGRPLSAFLQALQKSVAGAPSSLSTSFPHRRRKS